MGWFNKLKDENQGIGRPLIHGYVSFRSSIYGRVVFIIAVSSFFLFISFGIIFRSVNESYIKTVISENGNNVGYLVEGALYRSMLENDQSSLQSTLDMINSMSGIDDVSMYDQNNVLAYTSIADFGRSEANPDCLSCHTNLDQLFSRTDKSYRIIDDDSPCAMNPSEAGTRHLLIKSPILNNPSCYTSACHAHSADEDVLGSLIIRMPLEGLDNAMQQSSNEFYLLAALMTILLSGALLAFTNKKIKNPLQDLVRASIAVANGDTSKRLRVKPNQLSDIHMMSMAFNEMLDNLQSANNELQNWSQQLEYKVQKKSEELGQAQNELINIERIASLGKLSLSVAHEINNPLSGILVYAKLVSKQLNNQELDPSKKESMLKHLKLIENETKRCGDIVKGLLDFSRKDQENHEPKHLHEILRDTFELMSHPMKIANIHFWTDFNARHDLIQCSANQIKQACVAMLVNASEAITENGEIIIRTENPDEEHIRIDITDNGIGIAEEDIQHVFEPFFSTKDKVSGTGLGLSIVHGIVQSHKGRISVKSIRGKETTLSVLLPLIKNVNS